MRNFDSYHRNHPPRCAKGIAFDKPAPVYSGDAPGGTLEVGRHFTPSAVVLPPTERVFVDLDPYGEREEFKREYFGGNH